MTSPPPESGADGNAVERLRQELAREVRISTALREVGVALGTTLDLDDLLELILGRLTDLLDADRSTLYLVDEARGDLVSRTMVGARVRSIRVKIGHGIAGTVAQTGNPIRVKEAYKDPRFEAEWDLLTGYRTTCMLAAPLKNHLGRTIGVIQVLNKSNGEFNDEDEAILTALSTQAAVAIDNSRLFLSLIQKNRQLLDTKDQLERKVRDLQLLFELERATSRAQSLEDLVVASLSTAAKSCESRGAALLLSSPNSGDLVQYIYDDDERGGLDRFGTKFGEGFLATVLGTGEVLRVREAGKDPRWHERVEGRYPFAVESVLALRLEAEPRPLGALALLTKRGGRAFTEEDEALVKLLSANVSTALRLFEANKERERSARLTSIGRLLSQVIHDFKTPMTVISGYVQLLERAEEAEVRADYAARILKQFDVLSAMQREVLEFARGERKIFIRKVYLHKFFSDIRQQLEQEVDGRAVELELDIDTKLVARFDEARVARAVHNLARNAVEAMSETGGVLKLEAHRDEHDLVIAVSDTGPGVPGEIQGQLFQSFVTAGKKGGTGLGLAIVKKIVEEHGGRVDVVKVPRGARFELRFPFERPPLAKSGDRGEKNSKRPPAEQPAADRT